MNYIFLDVDGVLNNSEYLLKYKDSDGVINEDAVRLLAKLVKKFNAKVILSSSWRNGYDDNMKPTHPTYKLFDGTEVEGRCLKLLKMLNKYGIELSGKVDNISEGTHWSRPTEIWRYVKEHLALEDNYIILDDDDVVGEAHPDLANELSLHFVKTDFYKNGFDKEAYDFAVEILNS